MRRVVHSFQISKRFCSTSSNDEQTVRMAAMMKDLTEKKGQSYKNILTRLTHQHGIARVSTVRVKPEAKDDFLKYYHEHISKAYTDPGFLGNDVLLSEDDDTVVSTTYWKDERSMHRNGLVPGYAQTMQGLLQFVNGRPKVSTYNIVHRSSGPSSNEDSRKDADDCGISKDSFGQSNGVDRHDTPCDVIADTEPTVLPGYKRTSKRLATPSNTRAGGGIDYSY